MNGPMGPGMQQQPDLSKSTAIKCDKCGNPYFNQVQALRKISKFVTGGDQDTIAAIPILECASCGHVNEELKPKFSADEETKLKKD